jgi:protease PrsW
MAVLILLGLAILPVILLLVYFYRRDKRKPEPKGLIIKVFLFGMLATVAALIIETGEIKVLDRLVGNSWVYNLVLAFGVAALTEEWLKRLVVKRFAYRNVAFDEVMDGVVYAVVASLGLACLENIEYVMSFGMPTAIMRAFTAVPMHAMTAGIMGFYIGMAKFSGSPELERKYFRKGLLLAILFHGLYDFLVFSKSDMRDLIGVWGVLLCLLGALVVLVIGFILLGRLMKTAIRGDIAAGRIQSAATSATAAWYAPSAWTPGPPAYGAQPTVGAETRIQGVP